MIIHRATTPDAPAIADIYNHYVATSHSTFELEHIDDSQMLTRINDSLSAGEPFLVAEDNGEIIGYAYGHQFKPRAAYANSLEISVYIRPGSQSRGVGTQLYEYLFDEIPAGRFHTVIAGISLPNDQHKTSREIWLRQGPAFEGGRLEIWRAHRRGLLAENAAKIVRPASLWQRDCLIRPRITLIVTC